MVWINYDCINSTPKGRNGEVMFGGAMCCCRKCADKRFKANIKRCEEEKCPHCNGTGKRS